MNAINLGSPKGALPEAPALGVFATSDHRISEDARKRGAYVAKHAAEVLAGQVKNLDGSPARVVYTQVLVDNEASADQVAQQFKEAGVGAIICVPDCWSFPQLTAISLLSHFPESTPFNVTCGNSAPRPGVVYANALTGALAQSGRLSHLNVGTWPDTGDKPKMTKSTAQSMIDWAQAALTFAGLKGRRVLIWGHDSMGMETALQHIIPTRRTFGLEITRLDMKLLADMLAKKSYNAKELKALRSWIGKTAGSIELPDASAEERFTQSLAMYLITRDMMKDLNAIGGGFMSQLEWGSDRRGLPLPVADAMECMFNSSFDHNGRKNPMPYATEADMQALLTMIFFTSLSGGGAPLFMDFRKVWEPWEIQGVAKELGVKFSKDDEWAQRGFFDGNNSGSAAFDWAGKPGASPEELMKKVSFPLADPGYFPGGGNSATFITPGGIEGMLGRIAYHEPTQRFALIWDEAKTVSIPNAVQEKIRKLTDPKWPHTWVSSKYATMAEMKQYCPANHIHMVQGLSPARLEYFLDLARIRSITPWAARPSYIEGVDRPKPVEMLLSGQI